MIKLNRIKVSNFKNIKEADVTFGDFNVIVGPNNSGKSNFLQVLGFLNFVINGAGDEVKRGFLRNSWGSYEDVMDIDFTFSSKEKEALVYAYSRIEIEFENEKNEEINYSISFKYPFPHPIDENQLAAALNIVIEDESLFIKSKGRTGKAIRVFERHGKQIVLNSDLKKMHYAFDNVSDQSSLVRVINPLIGASKIESLGIVEALNVMLSTPVYYLSSSEIAKDPEMRNLFSGGRKVAIDIDKDIYNLFELQHNQEYINVLNSIINVDSFYFHASSSIKSDFLNNSLVNKLLFVRHNGEDKFISSLSDGTLVLLGLISAIFSSRYNSFLIEEPENSIHPKALRDLIDFMREHQGEKQFIITTHSPIVVNMAQPEEIIVAQIGEDGSSTIGNVKNPKEIRKLLRNGFSTMTDEIFFNYGKENLFEIEE